MAHDGCMLQWLNGWTYIVLPFEESTMVALFRKIVKAEFSFPKWMSKDAISLLTAILNPDPDTRATLADIKAHPWYAIYPLYATVNRSITSCHVM
jgi:serine/threonine protein kinase